MATHFNAQMESSPPATNSLTSAQQQAIAARGNVLVMAGAGTGKTKTLVERCLHLLCGEEVSLDEILVVTFTEAAAAEMRQRLRRALEDSLAAHPPTLRPFCAEQLALFDAAHIGTLHGFCFKLVREHFHELGLDPQPAILDEGEARLLAGETLDELFAAHYAGDDEFSLAVQDLIQIYGGGRDESIRKLVLRLHHYAQTRPDAAGWLARQIEEFSAAQPAAWHAWLLDAIQVWRDEWLPVLEHAKSQNEKAADLAGILSRLGGAGAAAAEAVGRDVHPNGPAAGYTPFSREVAAEILEQIISADGNWPAKRKTVLRKPFEEFFDDAKFLLSLTAVKEGNDPLAEDWSWVRGPMATLLRLAREFSEAFSERKRDDGVLDFHDLEQFALKLLWNFETNMPTEIARRWRAKLRHVFVDEYQDINAAQDKIIQALSRDGESGNSAPPSAAGQSAGMSVHSTGNRFLVGDVKQSIYRFRLADPKIFRDYAKNWHGGSGQVIPLTDNFRSCESLLNFVNSVFSLLMREEIGGVAYADDAKLKFGSPETRADFSAARDAAPRVELLLRLKTKENSQSENGGEEADLDEVEKEARLVALRLRELKNSGHEIWDDAQQKFRAADWRDMAVLLRAPAGKAEIFAKQFARAGVPLAVACGGFFDSAEVLDWLSLLQLLDNPLQDVPCIAVLRSPLVGCSLDELAEIRLAANGHFWFALNQGRHPAAGISSEARAKISRFLERFSRWRQRARQASLSECLEQMLAETHYADWLRAQPRGSQRCANVEQFLRLARKFDQFQRQGLFRFLKFIEAQRAAEVEPEISAAADENAVWLMSIHQSKGLEFPVVALADLAKPFNTQDLRGEIILDEKYGLCPRVQPPGRGGRYPSLAHWLAQQHQRRELLGEELRLLYVALTRARDSLILTASVSEKTWDEKWTQPQILTPQILAGANSCADWLALWFAARCAEDAMRNETQGVLPELRWRIVKDSELPDQSATPNPEPEIEIPALDDVTAEKLRARLEWNYPFMAATERKAKSSVTALQRESAELDDEAEPLFPEKRFGKFRTPRSERQTAKLSAAETGAAHHRFLQHVSLERAADLNALAAEARRLEAGNFLSPDERAALDLEHIAAFWESEIGEKIRAQRESVRRELPFTARFSPTELARILGTTPETGLENEWVVVQGVVDLAVILPREIWLADFKTDEVRAAELTEKIRSYAPQLKLYAAALERIYSRPVTNCWLHFLAARRTVAI